MRSKPLPADVLQEIFDYFSDDMFTLHSCILVNRLWSEVATPLFWRKTSNLLSIPKKYIMGSIFRNWISCLSEESKNILSDNGIILTSPIKRPPMFDYLGFCRSLSYWDITKVVDDAYNLEVEDLVSINSGGLDNSRCLYNKYLIKQELFKTIVNRCSSIEFLDISESVHLDIPLPHLSGAEIWFSNLRELHCDVSTSSGFYYRLAQICRNIEIINCFYASRDNNGFAILIEVQNNLQQLGFKISHGIFSKACPNIERALLSHADTLTHLSLKGESMSIPLTVISAFNKLHTLELHFTDNINQEILERLESKSFPTLRVLKMGGILAPLEMILRLIRRTGGNLKIISLYGFVLPKEEVARIFNNEIIPRYCNKLEYVTVWCTEKHFKDIERILTSCHQLKGISMRTLPTDKKKLNGDPLFQLLSREAPKSLTKLRIRGKWDITPQALDTFLSIRKIEGKKLFSIHICLDEGDIEITSMHNEVIKKYQKCGILKYEVEGKFTGEFN
ncbi:10255_t:CDS:1 [Diversispora eburnea]|uniref:10255_t:CDS:1 n=1 Tax=Diversispora eburnea TaxID=1213867 RepID=A0A9N8WFA2_9GLOM|nr:10255_t:CDS:1 [Diversispora eburnea]